MSATAEEAALAAAARAGSASAFGALVRLHQQAVRAFLRKLSRNDADADDIAQETFIAAWGQMERYDQAASLRAWFCGIAYRKWLTAARSRRRSSQRDAAYLERAETGAGASGDDKLDLAAAFAALPEAERAALSLCLAAGLSHTEAASALGLPLGTLKSHVARGKAKLLEALSDGR